MNKGITIEEVLIEPNGTNDLEIKIQKDAHIWWDNTKTKRGLRCKYRGLTITQIYRKLKLKEDIILI